MGSRFWFLMSKVFVLIAALLLIMSPVIAGAQDPAEVGAWVVPGWLQAVLAVGLSFAAAGTSWLTGVAAKGLGSLFDWLAAKTSIDKLASVDEYLMGWISKVAEHEIQHAQESLKDGVLSRTEKRKFLTIPIEEAIKYFGLPWLGTLFGLQAHDVVGIKAQLIARAEHSLTKRKAALGPLALSRK